MNTAKDQTSTLAEFTTLSTLDQPNPNEQYEIRPEKESALFLADLSQSFPLSTMFMVRKTSGIFLLLIFMIGLLTFGSDSTQLSIENVRYSLNLPPFFLYYCGCGVMIASLVYWYAYIQTFQFGIKDGMFYITRGVFIKNVFDYPITSIENTGVKRDLLDALFGLSTVQLMTAHEASDDIAAVRGISVGAGNELHSFLRKLLQTHQSSRLDIVELVGEVRSNRKKLKKFSNKKD